MTLCSRIKIPWFCIVKFFGSIIITAGGAVSLPGNDHPVPLVLHMRYGPTVYSHSQFHRFVASGCTQRRKFRERRNSRPCRLLQFVLQLRPEHIAFNWMLSHSLPASLSLSSIMGGIILHLHAISLSFSVSRGGYKNKLNAEPPSPLKRAVS